VQALEEDEFSAGALGGPLLLARLREMLGLSLPDERRGFQPAVLSLHCNTRASRLPTGGLPGERHSNYTITQ
jgi:hypothetical protein